MGTSPDDSSLLLFAQSLGVSVRKICLLRQALTHSSYAKENPSPGRSDNERLEFLGDAVLKLVISDELMRRFPDRNEGQLSKMRAYVVSEKALAQAARTVGIGSVLSIGKGADKTGERHRDSVLADALEAVFGAIYLDSGVQECRRFIIRVLGQALDFASQSSLSVNYKEMLQEYLQRNGAPGPEYSVLDTRGPDHDQLFVTSVSHQGTVLGTGRGKNKKAATQLAARAALIRLGIIDEEERVQS